MILLAETPELLPPSPSRDDLSRSLDEQTVPLSGFSLFGVSNGENP